MVEIVSVKRIPSVAKRVSNAFWTLILGLIGFMDIVLGIVALLLCSFPIRDYIHLQEVLDAVGKKDDSLFWGVIYIPFVSSLWVLNGIYQLVQKCRQAAYLRFEFIKFCIILVVELLGFGLPYLIISEYTEKIVLIINYAEHNQYMILHLLLFNWVTTGIIVYQILTSFLVWYQNFSRKDRKGKEVVKFQASKQSGNSQDVLNWKRKEQEDLVGIINDFPNVSEEAPTQPQTSEQTDQP